MQDGRPSEADVQELLALLQKDRSLKDFRDAFGIPEDLEMFARRARFETHEQGVQVIKQGDKADHFFIVLSGQLRAVDVSGPRPQLLNYLPPGAIVGVRGLLGDKIRTATVEVVTNARLAYFDEDDWYWLIGINSRLKDYFENLEQTRVKQSAIDFPGRQWDEVVVAATKRHFVAFLATLPLPLTLLIAPIAFFLAAEILGIEFLAIITDNLTLLATLPFIIVAVLLMVYNYFDWRNDDLIVTTKRVVHIERVLFYGEQRKDAPLTRIQDVTVVSDIIDLIFEAATVHIKTAGADVIDIEHVRHAGHIREVISRERERAKARVAASDVAAIRQNIANQLNWQDELPQNVMAVAEAEGTVTSQPRTRHYGRLIDYFIPRSKEVNETEEGTAIVWRKHYFVLIGHIFLPTLALLASIYLFIASFAAWLPPFGAVVAVPIQVLLGVAILASIFWYIWEYDDWNKDIYKLTGVQIIDIESSSFRLRRTRREGSFDNIQGVYSDIPNFFHKLLNMGDVIIETAGTEETFTFRRVYDPASVREEIFSRWALYKQRERETNRDSTAKQIIQVLAEYHKLVTTP